MGIETWLLFVVTEAVLCLSPGPAVLTVVSQGVSGGARSGVWVSLGVLAANALYFAVSATGLFAVAVAGYELFFLIKLLAGYATIGARAAQYAQASRWIDRVGGSLLIGAGAGLAVLRRS